MKEPLIQKLRSLLATPVPRRKRTSVATWWEWRGRTYRLTPHFDGPEAESGAGVLKTAADPGR